MAVSHHLKPGLTDKTRAKMLTVDTVNRRVEAVIKDGSMIQIAVWDVPSAFRWPQEGETWIVRRDNGIWMLDHRVQSAVDQIYEPITSMSPGQMRLDATTVTDALGNGFLTGALSSIFTLAPSQVTAAYINSLIAGVSGPTNAITIVLPTGDYDFTGTTINAAGSYNISLMGQGSAYGGTRIKTNSVSGDLINAQRSGGFRLENLALWAQNSAYTGTLLDLGTTQVGVTGGALFRIRNCNFTCAANGTISNIVIDLKNALGGHIQDSYFIGGGVALKGTPTTSYFCNANTIGPANWFQQQTHVAIQDLTAGNTIIGNTFEPLFNGNAGMYFQDTTVPCNGLCILGNYMGDVIAPHAGSFCTIYGIGIEISGNLFQCQGGSSVTGVLTNGNCIGLSITGNAMQNLATGFFPFTGSHSRVTYLGNADTTVTTPVSSLANLGAGSLINQGSTLYAKGGITAF